MPIPVFDKFKSVTADGKVLDYDEIADIPIIRQDLINETPSVYGYYQHTGETNNEFIKGIIYYYNGKFKAVDGNGSGGKDPLIMSDAEIEIIGGDITPVEGRSYRLYASFNRHFEENEYCFGLLSAKGRIYAVIGTLFSAEGGLHILLKTVYDITGEKGDKGDAFTYDDFTVEQLEALKGKDGKDGKDGTNGADGKDGIDGKDAILNTTNITLTANGWTVAGIAFTQTVSVEGVTENSNIVISPYPQSMRQYTSAGVFAAYQLSDGIKFECYTKPTDSIYVNILVLRG